MTTTPDQAAARVTAFCDAWHVATGAHASTDGRSIILEGILNAGLVAEDLATLLAERDRLTAENAELRERNGRLAAPVIEWGVRWRNPEVHAEMPMKDEKAARYQVQRSQYATLIHRYRPRDVTAPDLARGPWIEGEPTTPPTNTGDDQ